MSSTGLKIAYSSTQMRVRAVFEAGYCNEVPALAEEHITRARNKMEQEKASGVIEIYEIYEDRIRLLWKAVQEDLAAGGKVDDRIILTIAAGAPKLEGVIVTPSPDPKVAFKFTLDVFPDLAASWNFDWLKLTVAQKLKEAEITKEVNMAQLYSAWLRVKMGGSVKDLPLSVAPGGDAEGNDGKPFSIIGNKARKEIAVIIKDKNLFRDKAAMNNLLKVAADVTQKLSESAGAKINFLKDGFVDRLKMGAQGLEKYGINLPGVYLIGFPAAIQKSSAQSEAASIPTTVTKQAAIQKKIAKEVKEEKVYAGKGLLKIRVEKDNMEAIIEGFEVAWYDHPDFSVDLDWLGNELERLGVKVGITDTIKAALGDDIGKQNDLNGKLVAVGSFAEPAKGPFIHPTYKDSKVSKDETGSIDIREMQQRKIVRADQLVAEIRFKDPAKNGMTLFGKNLKAPENNELVVSLGEGIEMRESGKYYATIDGVPIIQENAISINQILVHEGDVNLKTGNIRFDGSVEIKGAIDNGAVVEVSGDLIVHGTIRGGFVRVGGSLTAKGGIVTGELGRIRVRNDLIVDFMENSRLIVGGNMKVSKAIVNSQIVCGGSVEVEPVNGVAAGGSISCRKFLSTGKLGFPKGAVTQIFAGVNWRARLSVEVRTARLARIIAKNAEDRNALRELARKKEAQKTKKHEDMTKKLQTALSKGRQTIQNCKDHLAKAQANMTYDSESKVIVHKTLYANCRIEVGGVVVPILNDIAEVEVIPKRMRGSYIHALVKDEGAKPSGDKKDAPAAAAADKADKKAPAAAEAPKKAS